MDAQKNTPIEREEEDATVWEYASPQVSTA